MIEPATEIMDDLNNLIQTHNPFDRSLVVRTHDVWESKFPDVSSINRHISDAIFQGIDQIQGGQRSVLGVTVKAEKGLGKTHLISRIRRNLRARDDTFFVYMSETDYTDLDRINSMFLESLAMSLKQKGSQEFTQWQELAALLINQASNANYSIDVIVGKISKAIKKDRGLVDRLTAKICQLKPDLKDPYVVQAILWTLSERSLFAINWLAGRSLGQAQADALGLPILEDSEREARALGIASQVLDLIGDFRTVVICFDEVEPKNSSPSTGLSTPQVIALLAKDLYSKIKRGILMMAVFPQTWAHQIKVMPQAESVVDRIGEKVFDLQYLNSDDIIELISTWLNVFYSQHKLIPPTPTYPFDERVLRELGKERPIVRRVLQWCYKNWNINKPEVSNVLHKVEIAFNEEILALDSKIDNFLDDSALIADALRLAFKSLKGRKIDSVEIQEIQNIDTYAVDRGYLNFRIVGIDNGKTCKIGVSVLQESGAKYVSAGMKRLIDYKKFNFTRGCLVRSKAVKSGTQGAQYLDILVKDLGGEFVRLNGKDLQPLLAILNIFNAYEDYETSQEEIFDFMQKQGIAENNALICEILSDPSGQIPDVVDEDQILTSNISTDYSDDNDLLALSI